MFKILNLSSLDSGMSSGPPVRNVLKLEDSMEMCEDIRELLYGEEGSRYLYEVKEKIKVFSLQPT